MASYSVAEAKDRLPALLVAAERGEAVTITRRGKPVATLNAVVPPLKVADPAMMKRIQEKYAALIPYSDIDSVTVLRQVRYRDL